MAETKTDRFASTLDSPVPGSICLFVVYPSLSTPIRRAIRHISYEPMAADRQGVTTTWTSLRMKAKGIQLISYRDLIKQTRNKALPNGLKTR